MRVTRWEPGLPLTALPQGLAGAEAGVAEINEEAASIIHPFFR